MAGKRKREPGIYERMSAQGKVVFDVCVSVDGKQKWQRGFATKGEAKTARDEMKVALRRGQIGNAPIRLKMGDYIEKQWLPYIDANLRSRESARAYKAQVKHIVGFCRCPKSKDKKQPAHTYITRDECRTWVDRIGDARLAKLSPLDVEKWKVAVRDAGVGGAMQNAAFDRLRQALNHAVAWELIYRNPCDKVSAPVEPDHEAPVLSNDDVRRLLDAADETPSGALFHLVVHTGLRWGELTKLQWSDVDFAASALTIRRSTTKTDAGKRQIALAPTTLEKLREHRMQQMKKFVDLGGPPPQAVFTNARGGPLTQANFANRVWYPLRRRIALPEMHFHDLRHVHSTLLARADVHPSIMAMRLGHADARISLNTYTDLHPADQEPAALAVEALLKRDEGGSA